MNLGNNAPAYCVVSGVTGEGFDYCIIVAPPTKSHLNNSVYGGILLPRRHPWCGIKALEQSDPRIAGIRSTQEARFDDGHLPKPGWWGGTWTEYEENEPYFGYHSWLNDMEGPLRLRDLSTQIGYARQFVRKISKKAEMAYPAHTARKSLVYALGSILGQRREEQARVSEIVSSLSAELGKSITNQLKERV